jgi:oryzin
MKMKWEIFNVIIFAITPLLAAPAHSKRRSDQVIPGQYIIQLDPSLSAESVTEHLSRRNINPDNFFQFGSFNAYTGVFTDESIAAIVNLPDVLSIEPDRLIFQEWTSPTKARKRDLVTQANSPWHLGDVSHKAAGSTDYVFDNAAGQGQRAYILDSGIRLTHNEFGGRAVFGFNGVTGSAVQNGTNTDTDGHGTHVAGIAVGKQNGIANKAIVVDVKVSSGGSVSENITMMCKENRVPN